MNVNQDNAVFTLRRFGLLLKMETLGRWKIPLVVAGCVVGGSLLLSLFLGFFHNHFDHIDFYTNLLYFPGFIFTSRVFIPFHRKEWNIPTLMLPASHFEKGLVQLLLSSVGWILYLFLVYSLFSLLATGLNLLLWNFSTPLFLLFKSGGKIILHYLVIQSLFFLGAAVFKKAAALKTLLALLGVAFLLALIGFLMVKILFPGEMGRLFREEGLSWRYGSPSDGLLTLVRILYYGVLPLFCWTTAFLRLREIEIKDGVLIKSGGSICKLSSIWRIRCSRGGGRKTSASPPSERWRRNWG